MAEFITETQNVLGAIITTPKLSEKLLGKPPFRFLHDIVTSFIKTTNFPGGYYSEDMLDSSKVTDKERKLEFLMKLINVVQTATGKTTTCNPAKTIAGQEPEGTNNLLQLLASCASLSKETKDNAVKKALGGGDDVAEEAATKAAKEEEMERYRIEKQRKKQENVERKENDERESDAMKEKEDRETKEERDERNNKEENDKPVDVEKGKGATSPTEEEHYQSNKKERKEKENDKKDKQNKQKSSEISKPTKLMPSAGVDRPGTATARKPPPTVKSNTVEEETRVDNPTTVATVIKEERKGAGGKEKNDGEDEKDWMKLVEEHETAVRTHHHANADAAKGYLGKKAIEARDKQAEEKKLELERGEGGGTGIVLRSTKGKDKGSSSVGDTELSHLKDQLQMLTKAANPLGKFLEAIHDDIDAMSRELEMWKMEARTQAAAANDAHRQTQESLHDIHGKIQVVEESLKNQLIKTNLLRSTILGNDRVIETMINMVVSHDTGGGKRK